MTPLPIDSHLPQILNHLRTHHSLVIVAEPGAGKTTRVPPAILGAKILDPDHPNLIMLQPRRVAARAAAQRIAEENRWALGNEVGYHIRFERTIRPQTRLRVLTEGILTRQMLGDPFLEGIGAVILDEFHERSLNLDLAIAMLRETQQTVRPDLRLIVMSATIDAERAAAFLGRCPIVNVPGRSFGVEIEYHPRAAAPIAASAFDAVQDILNRPRSTGDILVFLPGAEEIRRAAAALQPVAERHELAVFPLHGSLPPEQQMLALRPSPHRKVILATNIAETSLTIDGVRWVIDSGLARVPAFDPRRGLDSLHLRNISKASAAQRAGRAGRTAPGVCLRLWSAKEHAVLDEFESPEIQRVDLCAAVLDLHKWGKTTPADFAWFEPPPAESLASAERLLDMIGALQNATLTPVGNQLAAFPLHPRIGRLLLAASEAGCPDEGATMAALLSERDIRQPDFTQPRHRRAPATQGASDLLLRLDDLASAEHHRFAPHLRDTGIDPIAARHIAQVRDELRRTIPRSPAGAAQPPPPETLLKLALLAYPDRVCRRRASDSATALMVGGAGVRLDPQSIVTREEFFLALDAGDDPRSRNREASVRIASAIEPQWPSELFPHAVRRESSIVFDEVRQRVVGRTTTRYRDLIISEDADARVDPHDAAAVLAEALSPKAREIFTSNERSADFLARLEFLRRSMPEHPWPEFGDAALKQTIADLCQNRTTADEVLRLPLAEALQSRLDFPLDQILRRHAPEQIEVPSGSRIALQYRPGRSPVLAVRLQEVFGWTDTPRLADGRVPVVMHLLGPNFRPVQITEDLRSFWATTYFQVRKDLRVRYPKHAWPENPLTAPAVAKGRHQNPRRGG